jgi:hypothetical protein
MRWWISSFFKAIHKPVFPPKGSAFKYKEEGGDLRQKRRQLKKYGLLPMYSLCGWEEDEWEEWGLFGKREGERKRRIMNEGWEERRKTNSVVGGGWRGSWKRKIC